MRDGPADVPFSASPVEQVTCGVVLLCREAEGDTLMVHRAPGDGAPWDLPTARFHASDLRRQAALRVLRDALGNSADAVRITIAPVFPSFFEPVPDSALAARHRFVYAIAHVDGPRPGALDTPHRWLRADEVMSAPLVRWAHAFLAPLTQAVIRRRGW